MGDENVTFSLLEGIAGSGRVVKDGEKAGRAMAREFGDPAWNLTDMPKPGPRRQRKRRQIPRDQRNPGLGKDGLLTGIDKAIAENADGIHASGRFRGATLPAELPPDLHY